MIITVTLNTGLDQTLFIPAFEPFRTTRATQSALGMGSKGIDTSWSLGCWGVPSLALGFAAGDIGHLMDTMLHAKGVATDFVWVNGSTRWNTVIVCQDHGCATTITTSTLEVLPEHLVDFDHKFNQALTGADCVALSGSCPKSVPMDFYPRLIERANAANIPVLLDSSGECLKASFNAKPWLVKPNWHELEDLAGENASSRQEIYALAKRLQGDSGVNMLVTLGVEGAYALIGESHYWIPTVPVKVVSAAGAGDAVIAGIAAALAEHKPIEEGLRLGFAMATATLLTPATADFRREDAECFLPRIELVRVN